MPLETIDYLHPNAAQDFTRSLRETGFGVLKNHPIPAERLQSIYANWQAFFDSEDKHNYRFNPGPQDGFFPADVSETAKGHKLKDLKEYYHIYPWGQIPDQLRQEILEYYADANALAAELLDWVQEHSPIEIKTEFSQPLSQMIANSEQTLLRVLHYPPLTGEEPEGALRAAAHEDINLLTVLPAASETGLQVLDKNQKWLDVPCDFGNLIINTGDMLQEASGHYFPSTTHRVVNPSGEAAKHSRISMPLFLHPRPDVVLSERYTAYSYLQERLRELGVI
ncbi:2OG-Fe(II) oxygenase family protein [Paraferrimonas sedimenticola]|uniref:2-oxoglutarate-dependent ethylene/succinate-forming enzyme n=1 Tax=Paraferrimonas sedimenticola TaxID=375674 RepID=A0AA37W2P1_9GAMM|nr:2OG-Fe(II) oxygenase family protein [Paraferrimonas sedimenticola]GLP97903.1 oxidoreductase [Paraferrimonas sedimenticola]